MLPPMNTVTLISQLHRPLNSQLPEKEEKQQVEASLVASLAWTDLRTQHKSTMSQQPLTSTSVGDHQQSSKENQNLGQ